MGKIIVAVGSTRRLKLNAVWETFSDNLADLLDGRQKPLQPIPIQQFGFMWGDDLRCREIHGNVDRVPTKVPQGLDMLPANLMR